MKAPFKMWANTDEEAKSIINYMKSLGGQWFYGAEDTASDVKRGGYYFEEGDMSYSSRYDRHYYDQHPYKEFHFTPPVHIEDQAPVKFMEVKLYGETPEEIQDNFEWLEGMGYRINPNCIAPKENFLKSKTLVGCTAGNILRDEEATYDDFLQEDGEDIDLHGYAEKYFVKDAMYEEVKPHSHYFKDVRNLEYIDVYRVLELFEVNNPCIDHAIKKLLVAGGRGAGKDIGQDVQEAIDSLERWKEMRREDSK